MSTQSAPVARWPPKHNYTKEDIALAHKISRFIDAVLDDDFLAELDILFTAKAEEELQQLYGWSWGLNHGGAREWTNGHYIT